MQFIVYAYDAPNTGAARAAQRDTHRARLREHPDLVKLAGPLFGDDGETAIGSVFIFEAATLAEIEEFMAIDPFVVHGVYGPLTIHPFKWTIGV